MIDYHAIAGAICVLIGLAYTWVYLRDVHRGITRPHIFSWIVWGLLQGIGGAVEFSQGASVGGCVLMANAAMNFAITAIAYQRGDKTFTQSDWITFISALAIIPIWVLTKEPLTAAVLAATVDFLGYIPSMRKAWDCPHEESLKVFGAWCIANLFGLASITPFTLVTALYPASYFGMNVLMCVTLIARRRALSRMAGV